MEEEEDEDKDSKNEIVDSLAPQVAAGNQQDDVPAAVVASPFVCQGHAPPVAAIAAAAGMDPNRGGPGHGGRTAGQAG